MFLFGNYETLTICQAMCTKHWVGGEVESKMQPLELGF